MLNPNTYPSLRTEPAVVPARLCRDHDPEAIALGGWYVEFKTPTQRACTDYCRSPHAALLNGLALAFRLGVQIEVRSLKFVLAFVIEAENADEARDVVEFLSLSATASEIDFSEFRVTPLRDDQEVVVWRKR